MSWIEIFRAGTHTDSQGRTRTWSEADLDKMVQSYDPAKAEAPLVLGHPKDNAPAYGWVEALRRSGQVLLAKFKQVPDAVQQLVADGRFKKRSISIYPDGRLRHVGLLGAAPPAVQGLKDIESFGDSDFELYEYATEQPTITWRGVKMTLEEARKALEEEKAKREAAEKQAAEFKAASDKASAEFAAAQQRQKKAALEARIDKLIAANKALPAEKPQLMAFAEQLGAADSEIEFSAGAGKKPLVEHFFDWIEATREKHGLFREYQDPDKTDGGKGDAGLYAGLTKCI